MAAATTGLTMAKMETASKKAAEKIREEIGDTKWGEAIDVICALHIKYIKEEIAK